MGARSLQDWTKKIPSDSTKTLLFCKSQQTLRFKHSHALCVVPHYNKLNKNVSCQVLVEACVSCVRCIGKWRAHLVMEDLYHQNESDFCQDQEQQDHKELQSREDVSLHDPN